MSFHIIDLTELDFFSKQISMYNNQREKHPTCFGRIMTIIFIILYLSLFLLYLCKALLKSEGKYFETDTGYEFPSIDLNNEIFYPTFAIEDGITYDEYIDETIYYPKVHYTTSKREGNIWVWKTKEIEIEKCDLNKFGTRYKEIFSKKYIENLYCLKNVNFTLKGHSSYDDYSFFNISFYPCKNTTENNNHCKSISEIGKRIDGNFVSMYFETVSLTPEDYKEPTKPKATNVFTSIGKGFFREFYVYLKIAEIDTDNGLIIEKLKKERYLQYDETTPMHSLRDESMFNPENSFCDVSVKLSDSMRKQKRTYTKITEVFYNTGGLMECIATILSIISFYPVKTLFEIDMINQLFKYNIKDNNLIIKTDNTFCYSKTNIKFEEQMKNVIFRNNEDNKKKGKLGDQKKLIQTVIAASNRKKFIINNDELHQLGEREYIGYGKLNKNNNIKINEKNNEDSYNKNILAKNKLFCYNKKPNEINENKNKNKDPNFNNSIPKRSLSNLTEKNNSSIFYNNFVNESNLKIKNQSEHNILHKTNFKRFKINSASNQSILKQLKYFEKESNQSSNKSLIMDEIKLNYSKLFCFLFRQYGSNSNSLFYKVGSKVFRSTLDSAKIFQISIRFNQIINLLSRSDRNNK